MDISKARPPVGDLDLSKFVRRSGASEKSIYETSGYLAQVREEDPWPDQIEPAPVSMNISNCRFLDPAPLDLEQPVRVACDVSCSGSLPEKDRHVEFRYRLVHRKNSLDTEERLAAEFRGKIAEGPYQTVETMNKLDVPLGPDDLTAGSELYLIAEAFRLDRKLSSTSKAISIVGGPTKVRRVRLSGGIFDPGKCFLLPDAMPGIREVVELHRNRPTDAMVIVGHAPKGSPVGLGLDRAKAVAAFLTNKWEEWLPWFHPDKGGKGQWSIHEAQLALESLGFYKGQSAGMFDEETDRALQAFQAAVNKEGKLHLTENGRLDSATRKALLWSYFRQDKTTLAKCGKPLVAGSQGNHDPVPMADGSMADEERLEVLFFERRLSPPLANEIIGPSDRGYALWMKAHVETKDFELHAFSVQVVDAKNRALTGAKATMTGPVLKAAVSDDHGWLALRGLPRGEYSMSIEHEGDRIHQETIRIPSNERQSGTVHPRSPEDQA